MLLFYREYDLDWFLCSIRNDFQVQRQNSKMRLVALPPADRKKLPKIRQPKSAAEKRAIKIRKARRLARQRAAAATVIQCACRQFLARRILADLRANTAATIIQMCWRRMQFNERVNLKRNSAIKIQCRFRIFKACKRTNALRVARAEKLRKAATVIQTEIRRYLARQELQRRRVAYAEKLRKAATVIQTATRGYLARQELQRRRVAHAEWLRNAATCIQSNWRGHAYREDQRREKERVAATKIQGVFRGNAGRERYLGLRAEHNAKEAERTMKEANIVAAAASSTLALDSAVYARVLEGVVHNKEVSDYMTKRELFYKYVCGSYVRLVKSQSPALAALKA